MKRLAAAFLLIAIAASVYGQRTVTEITKSTNKQEDEKANSDAVPDGAGAGGAAVGAGDGGRGRRPAACPGIP